MRMLHKLDQNTHVLYFFILTAYKLHGIFVYTLHGKRKIFFSYSRVGVHKIFKLNAHISRR